MVTHFPSLIRFSRVISVHTYGAIREWLFSPISVSGSSRLAGLILGQPPIRENYTLFAFMAFSTSMLLFNPLEYLAMLMAIPAIWARA